MSGTAIDVALRGLLSVFTAAAPAGWQVIDGRPYDPRRNSFVVVGWAGQDVSAVALQRGPSNAAASASIEDFTVACQLSKWSGSDLTPTVRSAAFAALNALDGALAADPMLDNTVMFASIVDYDYFPHFAAEGACARINFSVRVRATS